MSQPAQVHVLRSGFVDSTHGVAACSVDASGGVTAELNPGDADRVVLMRSAAKPFQAALAVAAGVLDRFGLDNRHLAVACGSHNASEQHLQLVHEILTAAGVHHSAVKCGDDGAGGPFRHQCSGNHALALAFCVANGWDVDGYLDRDHPAQVAYVGVIEQVCGIAPVLAADGCGMTAFGIPLSGIALAFGRLGSGWAELDGLARCRDAMQAHPELVRWPGEIDTELMKADPALTSKIGAEAVIGIGHLDGRGAAARVLDGNLRALPPLGVAAAELLGLDLDAPNAERPDATTMANAPAPNGAAAIADSPNGAAPVADSTNGAATVADSTKGAAAIAQLRRPPLKDNRGDIVGHLELVR